MNKKLILYIAAFLIGMGIGVGIDYKYEQIRYNTIKTLTETKILELMSNKQYEEAIVDTGALFALTNDDIEYRLYLADTYERMGKTELALEEYNKIIQAIKEPNEYKKRAIEKIKLLNKSLEGHTINENNSSP